MKIQVLQHVPFEGPGTIAPFLQSSGEHEVQIVHLYRGETPAEGDHADLLIIMGGPMSVHDEAELPWLIAEKRWIAQAIEAERKVLGICLGAQLIANVMGADVRPMGYREIGWHPVLADTDWQAGWGQGLFPDHFEPLHWHGETFDIPKGATRLGSSSACANQGFSYGSNIVGLQFHLEFNASSVRRLARAAPQELKASTYVQSEEQMLQNQGRFDAAHQLMQRLLGRLCAAP